MNGAVNLEDLVKMVTHNLRAPVARLAGLATVLKISKDEAFRNELVEKIEKSAGEFDLVIRDISKMLQTIEGPRFATEPICLIDKIKQAISLLAEDIKEANCSITINVTHSLFIKGIEPYILSIFLNLISNSLKYKSASYPVIKIGAFSNASQTILVYSDNGLGIDLTKYGTLMFKQNERFHSHREGSGLGLYLIKKHIDDMGGKITVESEPGVGTTFKISLRTAKSKI